MLIKNLLIAVILCGLGFYYFFGPKQISPTQKKELSSMIKSDPGVIIDVRTLSEWESGHIDRATHADWNSGDFKTVAATLDKSKTYYLYCAAGGRSAKATEYLKNLGFTKVFNIGGYEEAKKIIEASK